MRLSFEYTIKNVCKKELDIIKGLLWHVKKINNMLLYDIREGNGK